MWKYKKEFENKIIGLKSGVIDTRKTPAETIYKRSLKFPKLIKFIEQVEKQTEISTKADTKETKKSAK